MTVSSGRPAEQVVVGFTGSPASSAALRLAASLFPTAEVIAVHVRPGLNGGQYLAAATGLAAAADDDDHMVWLSEHLGRAASDVLRGRPCRLILTTGPLVPALARAASEGAGAIVLGRGRGTRIRQALRLPTVHRRLRAETAVHVVAS